MWSCLAVSRGSECARALCLHGHKHMQSYAHIPTRVKKHTQAAHWMLCILWCGWLSVKISRSDSPGPSFHYGSSSPPDTYNPITFYRSASARARASPHRHKRIDPASEPANSKGRHKKSRFTAMQSIGAKVFKANLDKLYQSNSSKKKRILVMIERLTQAEKIFFGVMHENDTEWTISN